jgi:DNA-binding transcriptional LysR family regulator
MDVPIVRRGRRYEGLTPEGAVVLAWAHRILAERDGLRQELSALGDGLTGTLRLGVIPTALPVAALLTTPFCESHPSRDSGSADREPTRGALDAAVPVDPTIYRLYEVVQVYGPTIRELIHEQTVAVLADVLRSHGARP